MQVKHNNLGTINTNEVILSKNDVSLRLTFSYETCVGIYLTGNEVYINAVHTNLWSTTTGKLLNKLQPDHKLRLSQEDFKAKLSEAMTAFENA